jgi:hypothetical protein
MMTDTTNAQQETASHGRLRDGYDAAYGRTVETTGKAIDAASQAAQRASRSMEANPIGLLVGGIAVGAAVGALLPRSTREKELLAPIGARIGTTARAAIAAAKDAGKAELETRGLTKDAAREQVKGVFDGVLKAANSAGAAATKSASPQ